MEQKKRRPTRQQRRNGLIINVLTLIVLVLLIFEGKSLISLFSRQSLRERIVAEEEEVFANANLLPPETESESDSSVSAADNPVSETKAASAETEAVVPETELDTRTIGLPEGYEEYMDVVVAEQALAIDESYFDDAVFIGDSRMEGFRNFSGITSGRFVTAVGMELENIYTDAQIPTANGNVLVMDALDNLSFTKIYMMLGTNELGAYDMETVRESYRKVLSDVKERASTTDPIVYVYSVIYVDEALVSTGDYVNNQNVDSINRQILQLCKEENYHYINLNEVLSDGNHSLISGASEDGIHMTQEYSKKWLDYTKTHYLPQV